MKLLSVFAAFGVMALVLGFALWLLVVKGVALPCLAAVAAFVIASGKFGCLPQ